MFSLLDRELDGHDWPAVAGERNYVGPLAPAVPGAVAGLWEAHRRAGRLPWESLLAPAVELAGAGLEVTWVLSMEIAARLPEIVTRPELAAILLPSGRPPRARTADGAGERLSQGDLAATLRGIAADGPNAFYRGPTADAIAATLRTGGGIMTAEDLAGYSPKVIAEAPSTYRGLRYVTAVDSVGYETLGILEHFPLGRARRGHARALPPAGRGDGARFRRQRELRLRPRLHRRARLAAQEPRVRGRARGEHRPRRRRSPADRSHRRPGSTPRSRPERRPPVASTARPRSSPPIPTGTWSL